MVIMLCHFQREINHTQGSLLGNGSNRTKYSMCCQMLLVTIEKFDINFVLVNVNKVKPYKYMESKVHR
jgi:hypothetical protein